MAIDSYWFAKICHPNNVKCFYGSKYSGPSQMPIYKDLMLSVPESLHITCSSTLHNHPTGDPNPSAEDISITKRLKEVGELIGIPVLDHIVIGDGKYVSFAERGLL